ncbi:MAG: AmmeMemoRadiSam system protein B [bacterium]
MGRKTILITIISGILCIAVIIFSLLNWNRSEQFSHGITVPVAYGSPALWDRILAEPGIIAVPGSTRAVILPHHLITAPELTKIYRSLSEQFQPKVVILVGPNHFEKGEQNIQTCNSTYTTVRGDLKTTPKIVQEVTQKNLAAINCQSFEKEHSIYAHATFIKEFFPTAEFVPFTLKVDTSDKEIDQLALYMNLLADKQDILVIASVDFSHYMPYSVADFHDQSSFTAIQNFDYDELKSIEVDSPASLRAITRWAEKENLMNVSLLNHTNSQDFFFQQKPEQTTSHLYISFSSGEKKQSPQISLHFFGDAMFDRKIASLLGAEDILSTIAGQEERFFKGNNFNILNLEGVLSYQKKAQNKPVIFRFNPEQVLPLLKKYRFNLLNLANNHTLDYFLAGDEDTRNFLNKANIRSFGAYEINNKTCATIDKNNLKIALCGFNDVGGVLPTEPALQIISNAKKNHDFVFLNVHWGEEYGTMPTTRQRDLAQKFINAGADLIIGHHPHVIQPLEIYQGKPIFYSLGNFIFDQDSPEEVNIGLSVGVIAAQQKTTLYLFPFHSNAGKPSLLNNEEVTKFLDQFIQGLESYQTDILSKLEIN